MNKDYKTK